MITATIDTRGLQFIIDGLQNALIGSGGDVSTVLKDESRLLATEIAKVCRPKKKQEGEDKAPVDLRIEKSVRRKFQALKENSSDLFESKSGNESNGIKWYRCDDRFLYGVARDSDMRKASGETLANIYYASKMMQGKMRIIVPFKYPRKKQMVAITTKVVTTKSAVNRAIARVKLSIGKLSASWLASARKIDPTKNTPAPKWIERHIKGDKTTKSITDCSSLQSSNNPSVIFGSKAVGVAKFQRAIQFAVNLREKKVSAKLRLILSGYSRDVKNGIKLQRRGGATP